MAADIGTSIKRARELKRWTQRQLADALGVNIKTVDNWENGRTSPRNSIGAIESVLDIRLAGGQNGQEPPAFTTPDEAAIWAMDRFSEHERRMLIRKLRETRGEALTHASPERDWM